MYIQRNALSSLLLHVHLTWAPVCVHSALDNAVKCRITDTMIPEQQCSSRHAASKVNIDRL